MKASRHGQAESADAAAVIKRPAWIHWAEMPLELGQQAGDESLAGGEEFVAMGVDVRRRESVVREDAIIWIDPAPPFPDAVSVAHALARTSTGHSPSPRLT